MKRTTRSSSKTGLSKDADVENLAGQMLASLGITKSKPSSPSSSTMHSPSTVRKARPLSSTNGGGSIGRSTPLSVRQQSDGSPRGMAVDSTPVHKSRTASSSGSHIARSRTVSNNSDERERQAPLTAIRRPLQSSRNAVVPQSPRTASHSTVQGTNSNNNLLNTSRRKASSSALPQRAAPPPPAHSEEEYASLVSLLATKDDEITRLKAQLEESETRATELEERCKKAEKEKEEMRFASLAATKAQASGNASGSSSMTTSPSVGHALNRQNSSNANGAEPGMSRREVEDLKKQYAMQENLLEGFQRENEKAHAEIDGLKRRERTLTEHLKKIYGPSFSIEAELSSPSSSGLPSLPVSASFGSPSTISSSARRRSGMMNGFVAQPSPLSQADPLQNGNEHLGKAANGEEQGSGEEVLNGNMLPASFDADALMGQLLSVQNLVQRFERRLLSRESELIKKEQEARDEVRRLEALLPAI